MITESDKAIYSGTVGVLGVSLCEVGGELL